MAQRSQSEPPGEAKAGSAGATMRRPTTERLIAIRFGSSYLLLLSERMAFLP